MKNINKLHILLDKIIYGKEYTKGVTKTITINYNGKKHNMGKYIIRIENSTNNIKIFKYKTFLRIFKSSDEFGEHPHISNGDPCFGNLITNIKLAQKEKDYESLFYWTIELLCSYNRDGAYRKLPIDKQ